jgi:hypothetical protein
MSPQAETLLRLYEQLPEDERAEVVAFTRKLVDHTAPRAPRSAIDVWLETARGAAVAGTITDGLLSETR